MHIIPRHPVQRLLNRYPARVCKREFDNQTFVRFNERPVEYSFVFRTIGAVYPRTVLDVGAGGTALPHLLRNCGCLVTAIDNMHDYWPSGMTNRHYHVIDDDITATRLTGRYDLITCISVLEHIAHPDAAVRNMFALLEADGRLILTFPYTENLYLDNVYALPESSYGRGRPYVTRSYSRRELNRWMEENGGIIVNQEYWRFWEGDFWTAGEQIIPPVRTVATDMHQLTCILARKE